MTDMNAVYRERNHLAAMLARLYPSGVKKTDIPGWDPEWHNAVYIDTPMGQLSWHYHDSDADLFANLEPYAGEWDGHTTEEKYDRLARLMFRIDSMKLDSATYVEEAVFETGEQALVAGILGEDLPPAGPPLKPAYLDFIQGRDDDQGKLQASVPSLEDGRS